MRPSKTWLRMVATAIAALFLVLPGREAGATGMKPSCAMHAARRLPCHESAQATSMPGHACCKGKVALRTLGCACDHGSDAARAQQESPLATPPLRVAAPGRVSVVPRPVTSRPLDAADPPDTPPPNRAS